MDAARKAYDDIVDLFASGTSSARILAFRPSKESQQRVRYLLERNKAGGLSAEEAAELDRFGELEHLMSLSKLARISTPRVRGESGSYIRSAQTAGGEARWKPLRVLFDLPK